MIFTANKYLLYTFILLASFACAKTDPPVNIDDAFIIEADTITFAVIGDYGDAGPAEDSVSKLVKSWSPDFIITTGDNNYPYGEMSTIINNISQYYGDYIYNYDAPEDYRCNGKAFEDEINRFFPSPGNHDNNAVDSLTPYLDFFTLPGIESHYSFEWGPVKFFSINSVTKNIESQKLWFEEEIAKSNSPFNIVYFHHPPYSMSTRGNVDYMHWGFYDLGVDVVLTGHDHIYSRIEINEEPGMYYIVNGLGGRIKYECSSNFLPDNPLTAVCYCENYGAMKVSANNENLELKFYSISNLKAAIDSVSISK